MSRVKKQPLLQLLVERYPEYDKERLASFAVCRNILVNGEVCTDAKSEIPFDSRIDIVFDQFVSRGAYKLLHALRVWEIDCQGLTMLDAGSSTGGFTDCLLQHGAKLVHAVDVGYNQLHWKLRNDSRVVVHERQNIMTLDSLNPKPDAAVADLSFRSLQHVATRLFSLIGGNWVICLIKPQFEVPKDLAGFSGIVEDPEEIKKVLIRLFDTFEEEEIAVQGLTESPIKGRKGNREFLVLLSRTHGIDRTRFIQLAEDLLHV